MADNIQITAGSGTKVGTDQRTIDSVADVHVQRTDPIGTTTLATAQANVTTTAATLVAANTTRRRVTLVNQGTVDVFIGPPTVTSTNGFRLASGAGITLETTALIQAIASSGTQKVHYIEEYD